MDLNTRVGFVGVTLVTSSHRAPPHVMEQTRSVTPGETLLDI